MATITVGGVTYDVALQSDASSRPVSAIGDPVTSAVAGVTTDGRVQVKLDLSATPAVTSVAISAASVSLVAADATGGRTHLLLYNDTTQIAYVRLGTEAAVIAPVGAAGGFTFEVVAGGYWESPRNYVGAATCIWPSATGGGAMRVTTI